MQRKLYAGARLRAIRQSEGLTQKALAARLGVSLPYLNQMENNHRPLSGKVITALTAELGVDPASLETSGEAQVLGDLREALADPLFTDVPELSELRLAAANSPTLMRAFLVLHGAYRQSQGRLAAMDETLDRAGSVALSPWEEVRDFFHYCDNYIDPIDRAAEQLSGTDDPVTTATARLARQGIRVTQGSGPMRRYDPARRVLTLSQQTPTETRNFQLLHQYALLTQGPLLDATLDLARLRSPEAQKIARIGLANYFAGAALMPYGAFRKAALEVRHDLERLAQRFGASLEQVAHRLSTLQRPGAKGIPFFFVRVDPAGTITKRHSAAPLQFARYGGACPLWNVHRAFETPGRWLRQLAETPDGVRYFCLARDVSKSGGGFDMPLRRYAIGLGCEIAHAPGLVYADHLDISSAGAFEPIGISCRLCERDECAQRAVPPLERGVSVDPNLRSDLPYGLE